MRETGWRCGVAGLDRRGHWHDESDGVMAVRREQVRHGIMTFDISKLYTYLLSSYRHHANSINISEN